MNTVIKTGKYEIVESKVLFLDSLDSELWIHLAVDGELLGDIQIQFTVQEKKEPVIRCELENNILTIIWVNFNQSFGSGTTEPIEIGIVRGKSVKFHMWSYLMGHQKVRKIEYNIFREI